MGRILYIVFQTLAMLTQALIWLIILRAVLSWFIQPHSKYYKYYYYLIRITEPLNRPFRPLVQRFMSPGMPIDLTPMLALIALQILQGLFRQLSFMTMGLPL